MSSSSTNNLVKLAVATVIMCCFVTVSGYAQTAGSALGPCDIDPSRCPKVTPPAQPPPPPPAKASNPNSGSSVPTNTSNNSSSSSGAGSNSSTTSGSNKYEKAQEALSATRDIIGGIFAAYEAREAAKEARAVEEANREYSAEKNEQRRLASEIEKEMERSSQAENAKVVDEIEKEMARESLRAKFGTAIDEIIKHAQEMRNSAQDYLNKKKDELIKGLPDSAANKLLNTFAKQMESEGLLSNRQDILGSGDVLNKGVTSLVNNVLEEENDSRAPSSSGVWIKNKVAKVVGKLVTKELRTQLTNQLGAEGFKPCADNADKVAAADCELWQAAAPNNLSQGVKPYMENLVKKFGTFFGLANDRFVDKTESQ